jgi:hypothetical protein
LPINRPPTHVGQAPNPSLRAGLKRILTDLAGNALLDLSEGPIVNLHFLKGQQGGGFGLIGALRAAVRGMVRWANPLAGCKGYLWRLN